MKYNSDWLDMTADEFNDIEQARVDQYRSEIQQRIIKRHGIRVISIGPLNSKLQIVKWIRQAGAIENSIPLAGGIMHTTTRLVEVEDEEYLLKTGWFQKGSKVMRTLNPDKTIVELVKRSVANGNVI
jgi:hypothetical protein